MKKLKTFENFKMNESVNFQNLSDLEGQTLTDGQYELYIDISYLELIDPEGNNGHGEVIFTYPIPDFGETVDMDDNEPEDDLEPQLFFEDSGSYLEFIENGKVFHTFSFDDAEIMSAYKK